MKTLQYISDCPSNMGGWKERHLKAVANPRHIAEGPLLYMIQGWIDYAASHKSRFGSEVGEDYVLGDEWFAIGMALLGLLNGDLGRLDGGTLDTIIRDNLIEQGYDCDLGERRKS